MVKKYSIFHIEGGLGKHVAATAVAKCIKNNHSDRDLIIVCSYPEIFVNLPYVDRVYRVGYTPYFYSDFIDDKDFILFKHEPYFTTSHLKKEKNLIENWCELFGLGYSGEQPTIIFNMREEQVFKHKWYRDKPIVLIHTNGGVIGKQPYLYSWTRDMPLDVATAIINKYKDTHHIIQVCRDNKQGLSFLSKNIEVISDTISNMELFYLLKVSNKRYLIDSSLQHASAALDISSNVFWVGTSPDIFGYEIHNNIVANISNRGKLVDSYLFDYSFDGILRECPFSISDNIFDTQIINEL